MPSWPLANWRRASVYVGTVVAILLGWAVLAQSGMVQPLLLASPADTWASLVGLGGDHQGVLGPVGVTLGETAVAFVVALLLAVPAGVVIGSVTLLRRAYEPVLTTASVLPLVVLYPVLAATLGVGPPSKIALGALYAFFPMAIAALRAAATIDDRLVVAATTMGANRSQRLLSVVVPSVLPPVLASMRVALGLALVTIIAGEFISGAQGVGYELGAASQRLNTPLLFAWIVVACLLTVLINLLFTLLSNVARKGIYR